MILQKLHDGTLVDGEHVAADHVRTDGVRVPPLHAAVGHRHWHGHDQRELEEFQCALVGTVLFGDDCIRFICAARRIAELDQSWSFGTIPFIEHGVWSASTPSCRQQYVNRDSKSDQSIEIATRTGEFID